MNRETFQRNAKKSIDDIFANIEKLQEIANKAKGETKVRYEEKITELRIKLKDLQVKCDELQTATDEKWEEVKKSFSSASDSFKEGLNKITSVFK